MTKLNYTLKQAWDDGDIIVILITIISIIITEFASCLTSQNSRSSTPTPTKLATQSTPTTHTSISNTKIQRSSPSTKPRSTTVGLKKVDGGTKQATQSVATASSPRSKRSKPSSSTSKSTKSKVSSLLEIQQLTPTTNLDSQMS